MFGTLQIELGTIILGAIQSVWGLSALLRSLSRGNLRNILLASFGGVALLWGVLLLAGMPAVQAAFGSPSVTWNYVQAVLAYLLPVPFAAYLVGLFGTGWKGVYTWVLRAAILLSLIAVVFDLTRQRPFSALPAERALGVVWGLALLAAWSRSAVKPAGDKWILVAGFFVFAVAALGEIFGAETFLPRGVSGTGLGLTIVVFALGYVAVRHSVIDAKRSFLGEHEMDAARMVQFTLLPQEISSTQNLRIAQRFVPGPVAKGNFFDIVPAGDERVCILIGDVDAQGIPAAAIATVLKSILASQASPSADPAGMLSGMNRILAERTERKSSSAGCLVIDAVRGTMAYADAGHTPLIVWRRKERGFGEFGGSGVLLGQVPDAKYTNTFITLNAGDRVIMYSKGAIEALDRRGRLFGENRFRDLIRSNERLAPGQFAEAVTQGIMTWAGMNAGGTLTDDLSLVVVDMLGEENSVRD